MRKRIGKLFVALALLVSAFSGLGGTVSVLAAGVGVSGSLSADYGKTSIGFVTVTNNTGASITVDDVTVRALGGAVSAEYIGGAGIQLAEKESGQIAVSVFSYDPLGGNYAVEVVVDYTGGTATGYLAVSAKADPDASATPTPTPTESPRPIVSASTSAGLLSVKVGETVKASVTLKNTSRFNAVDVKISLPSQTGIAVIAEGGLPTSVSANSTASFTVAITVDKTVGAGIQALKVSGSFNSEDGKAGGNFDTIISISVGAVATPAPTPSTASLVVEGLTLSGSTMAGEAFTVSGAVRNSSSVAAKGVKIAIAPAAGVEVRNAALEKLLGDIGAGGKADFSFTFYASEGVKTGAYSVTFTPSALGADGKDAAGAAFGYSVRLEGKAGSTALGKLEVANVGKPAGLFKPGERFDVAFTLKNAGEGDVTGITVKSQPIDGIANASGNLQALDVLKPGESAVVTFSFMASANAATQFYVLQFDLAYTNGRDADGNAVAGALSRFVDVSVVNETAKGKLEVVEIVKPQGRFDIGQKFDVTMSVRNTGDGDVTGLVVKTADIPSGIVNASGNTQVAELLKPGEGKTFTFSFMANATAPTAFYMIRLDFSCATGKDSSGKAIEASFSQFAEVNIVNSEMDKKADPSKSARLEVANVTAPEGSYDTGENFSISLTLKNSGDTSADQVVVNAKPPAGIIPTSANMVNLGSIAEGDSKTVTFTFAPTAESTTQFTAVELSVSYVAGADSSGAKRTESFSQFTGAKVVNSEKDKVAGNANKSVPKIIVSKYKVTAENDPADIVLAGQGFDLYLQFENTHPTKTVSNIKVTLSTPPSTAGGTTGDKGNTFSVVDGSNTIFVEEIAPGGSYEKTLRMESILTAAAKNHIITITFNYEYDGDQSTSQTEEIGVNVTQESKLEVGSIYLPSVIYANEQQGIWFSLQNTGRVTLYNVKVYLDAPDGGFDLSGSEKVIGNIASGGFTSYDGYYYGSEPGERKLNIMVQYDLETGKRVTDAHEFDVEVVANENGMMGGDPVWSGGDMGFDGGMPGEPQPELKGFAKIWDFVKNAPLAAKIGVPVGVAAVAVGVTLGIKRVLRKKRENAEAED